MGFCGPLLLIFAIWSQYAPQIKEGAEEAKNAVVKVFSAPVNAPDVK